MPVPNPQPVPRGTTVITGGRGGPQYVPTPAPTSNDPRVAAQQRAAASVGGEPSASVGGSAGGTPTKPKTLPQAASLGLYQFGRGMINPATGQPYGEGEYAGQAANDAYFYAGAQNARQAPQADLTGANADFGSARTYLQSAGAGILAGAGRLGEANQIGSQQQQLANMQLAAAQGQAPSVAQQAMQLAAAQQAQRNLAMASGVGGAGATAALINAQNQNATAQGQLQAQLGIQRAAEIAQARGELGNTLGTMRQQTAGEGLGYGTLGSQAAGIGQAYGSLGQIGGQQALGNAALRSQQNTLNQQGEQFYYGQGADWIKQQAQLNAGYAQNWNNYTVGQTSNAINAQIAKQQHDDQLLGGLISGAATVGTGILTGLTAGGAAPLFALSAADAANRIYRASDGTPHQTSSDIRGKTAIAPAGGDVSQAYRGIAGANEQANQIRTAEVQYPSVFSPLSSSSYFYKDPNAPGAEPGQHFGPMAQELEKTPAGASVVRTMPDGKKGIDTGRLALLNASETGQLRREVDALKSGGAPKRAAKLKQSNDRKEAALARLLASGVGDIGRSLQRPVSYPATQGVYPY